MRCQRLSDKFEQCKSKAKYVLTYIGNPPIYNKDNHREKEMRYVKIYVCGMHNFEEEGKLIIEWHKIIIKQIYGF